MGIFKKAAIPLLLLIALAQLSGVVKAEGEEAVPEKEPIRYLNKLEPSFAEYVMRMTFGCLMDDHSVGGEQLQGGKKDPRFEQWVKTTDFLLEEIGKVYSEDLASRGLGPARNASDYLAVPELTDPRYFDSYRYAQLKVAMRLLDCNIKRGEFFQRIGRKVYELLRNQIRSEANSDPEDLRNMREWMTKTIESFKLVGLVEDIGTTWPKGTYDKWASDGTGSFELWMKKPVMFNSTMRVYEEYRAKGADVISRVIGQHFKGYLVDISEKKFNPTKFVDQELVKIKYKVESLL